MAKWIRATYQAPFQDPPAAVEVRDMDRYRRSSLLRAIAFSVTMVLLVVSLPSVLFVQVQADQISLLSLLILIFAGVISLICNERGAVTFAGGMYTYGFFLSLYVYVVFTPFGLDALTISVYGFFNALLFLAGLTFSQKLVWYNGALVCAVSTLILILTPPDRAISLGRTASLPVLAAFLDTSYLLTTFLCWLAGSSGRVGMMKLAATLEQEKQLVALKDLFIVSANHELRTPIMTLSNNLELVARTLDRVDPEQRQEMLERALRASRDLKDILRNVLDVGVSEAEVSKQLHLEDLNVREVVQQALDTFDPRELGEPWLEKTTLKSRTVWLYIAPELTMRADGGRTRQVLINLLSNALKYSDASSSITISANLLESDGIRESGKPIIPAGTWVEIKVRDWGLGIPPREQALLFTRFVRLARDAASSTRGTGVGLYICRVLVQAMGGQIWVESNGVPGMGSVFTFLLPAASSNA
jgi:signal transduction histidine kinase